MPRALLISLLLAAVALSACDRRDASAPTAPPAPTRGEPDDTYTTRGVVEQLPAPDKPTSEFIVHHEAIDHFKNPNGTLGMSSMSMPFPLAKGLSLDGLAVGDKIQLEFVVWTKPGTRGYEVRKIEKLPPETELVFGKAKPAR